MHLNFILLTCSHCNKIFHFPLKAIYIIVCCSYTCPLSPGMHHLWQLVVNFRTFLIGMLCILLRVPSDSILALPQWVELCSYILLLLLLHSAIKTVLYRKHKHRDLQSRNDSDKNEQNKRKTE